MSSPAVGDPVNLPVNLLALDGGGIRGVSELVVLDEMMKRLQFDLGLADKPKPCDFFDLIGGTSTGGIIALLLGRLRMSTTEALQKYNEIAGNIFSAKNKKWMTQEEKFKAKTLEHEMKKIVMNTIQGSDGDTRMLDKDCTEKKGAAFVCAMPAKVMKHARRFRTYTARNNATPNCKIWEAARATTAAPMFFKRIAIGEPGHIKEEFLDAGIGCNNPTHELLDESRLHFGGDRPLGVLVSLGTGEKNSPSLAKSSALQKALPTKVTEPFNLITAVVKIATDSEKVADDMSRRFENVPDIYFRFNATHAAGEITLEEWKRMDEVQALTLAYLQEPSVSNSLNAAVKRIRLSMSTSVGVPVTLANVCGVMVQAPVSSPEVTPILFKKMPNASQNFTGRKVYLKTLKDHFSLEDSQSSSQRRKNFLLYGLGGSGKTQICLKFIEDNRDRFSETFWVDASSRETIKQSLEDIAQSPAAKALGVEKSADSVIQWLSRYEAEWLLIFDNADNDPDIVAKNIPQGKRGNVLITSRDPNARRLVAPKAWREVAEMDEDDAISLLLRAAFLEESSSDLRPHAKNIVRELSCLALAVDQAGAVIASGFCALQNYLKRYKTRGKELLAFPSFKGASDYDKAVFNTWDVSFEAMELKSRASGTREAEAAKNAILLLRIFAVFHNENIMEETFRRCAEAPDMGGYSHEEDPDGELPNMTDYLPKPLCQLDNDGKWEPFNFGEGIRILRSFSLIKPDASGSIFSVHPLVHFWTRASMSEATRQHHRRESTAILCASIELEGGTTEDYIFRRKLIPHIDAHCKHVAELELKTPCFSDEFHYYAHVFGESSNWEKAEELYEQVLETMKRVLGQEHLNTLLTMSRLGQAILNQRRWQEAEKIGIHVLDVTKRLFGQEDPATLQSMAELATIFWKQKRWQEAEELEMQVVKTRKRVLGQEHPVTLSSMTTLTLTLLELGRLQVAERLLTSLVETSSEVLGQKHPDTMKRIHHLALTYQEQEQFQIAKKLFTSLIETSSEVLGQKHPDTLKRIYFLALTYRKQEQFQKAEELFTSLIETSSEVLGQKHPDTLKRIFSLALTYRKQEQFQKAEELLTSLVETTSEVLGQKHPATLDRIRSLVLVYQEQGRLQEAEKLERDLAEGQEEELDKVLPETQGEEIEGGLREEQEEE